MSTSKCPPGFSGEFMDVVSSGNDDWYELPPYKHFTNVFVWNKETGKVLLGLKKRGFGVNMYNGFGGKVEGTETALEGAARELKEEAGISANLIPCGTLVFLTEGDKFTHYIHIFGAKEYEGEPTESDEMRPEWFAIPKEYLNDEAQHTESLPPIPFDKMWKDDQFWFPFMFSGKMFQGRADFRRASSDDAELDWIMDRYWFGSKC